MAFDDRKRQILFPVRVVKTFGNVTNAESLLIEKDVQIGFAEKELTFFENGYNFFLTAING